MKKEDDFKPQMSGKKPTSGPNIKAPRGKPHRVGTKIYARLPPPSNQQATVVASRNSMKTANGHAYYIEREGAGENGERPLCFSHDSDKVKAIDVVKEWSLDEGHYRHILPLRVDEMDPVAYTKGYVSKLEKDFGTSVQYVASVHKNTDQVHVHLMIRGVDDRGEKLDIADSYAHQIAWRRASDVATELAGPRTHEQILESIKREEKAIELGIIHPELNLEGGWHININVSASSKNEITRSVMDYMSDNQIPYKMNFKTDTSKMLVARVGSFDRAKSISEELEKDIGKGLEPIRNPYIHGTSLMLNEHMSATFSAKGDKDFSNITSEGIPITKEHAKELKELHWEERLERAKDFRDHADRELMERYGEFYGGKDRVNALERALELKREGQELGL